MDSVEKEPSSEIELHNIRPTRVELLGVAERTVPSYLVLVFDYLAYCYVKARIVVLVVTLPNHRSQRIGKEETTGAILFPRTRAGEDLPETKSLVTLRDRLLIREK